MSALDNARAALARHDAFAAEEFAHNGCVIPDSPALAALRALAHECARMLEPPISDDRQAIRMLLHLGTVIPFLSIDPIADSILAAGFRRQGPTTDAQVEAACIAFTCESQEEWFELASTYRATIFNDMRDALEAAWGV